VGDAGLGLGGGLCGVLAIAPGVDQGLLELARGPAQLGKLAGGLGALLVQLCGRGSEGGNGGAFESLLRRVGSPGVRGGSGSVASRRSAAGLGDNALRSWERPESSPFQPW